MAKDQKNVKTARKDEGLRGGRGWQKEGGGEKRSLQEGGGNEREKAHSSRGEMRQKPLRLGKEIGVQKHQTRRKESPHTGTAENADVTRQQRGHHPLYNRGRGEKDL